MKGFKNQKYCPGCRSMFSPDGRGPEPGVCPSCRSRARSRHISVKSILATARGHPSLSTGGRAY